MQSLPDSRSYLDSTQFAPKAKVAVGTGHTNIDPFHVVRRRRSTLPMGRNEFGGTSGTRRDGLPHRLLA